MKRPRASTVGIMVMAVVILLFAGGREVFGTISAGALALALLVLAVLVMGVGAVLIIRGEERDG